MSYSWASDIFRMHSHYGVHKVVDEFDEQRKRDFLEFRAACIQEELDELKAGLDDPEQVVDALIDICVFAIGTLDLFAVDPYEAWDQVNEANMRKRVGIKEGRPNPFGLPDLVKPEGWTGPSHKDNHGILPRKVEG